MTVSRRPEELLADPDYCADALHHAIEGLREADPRASAAVAFTGSSRSAVCW